MIFTHEEIIQTKLALKTYIDNLTDALDLIPNESQEECTRILKTCKSAYVKVDAVGRNYQREYETY